MASDQLLVRGTRKFTESFVVAAMVAKGFHVTQITISEQKSGCVCFTPTSCFRVVLLARIHLFQPWPIRQPLLECSPRRLADHLWQEPVEQVTGTHGTVTRKDE